MKDMKLPEFTAELSLYESRVYYRTSGAAASAEGRILPALSRNSLEALTFSTFVDGGKTCNGDTGGGCLSDYSESFGINMGWAVPASSEPKTRSALPAACLQGMMNRSRNIWVDPKSHIITRSDTLVTPASVPGHKTDLSGQCKACKEDCLGIMAGCDVGVGVACGALNLIPFFGTALFVACDLAGGLACAAGLDFCEKDCKNIGSACCPNNCGVSCCNYSEKCLDTSQGLCCSAGTEPCPGPQESCFNPRTEKCLPSGVGCPTGQVCGDQCCDSSTQLCINNSCCPIPQVCPNGLCCQPGYICNTASQCVVDNTCPPGEKVCISLDKTVRSCCPENGKCCKDGACCTFDPNRADQHVCCGDRGCILDWECT